MNSDIVKKNRQVRRCEMLHGILGTGSTTFYIFCKYYMLTTIGAWISYLFLQKGNPLRHLGALDP